MYKRKIGYQKNTSSPFNTRLIKWGIGIFAMFSIIFFVYALSPEVKHFFQGVAKQTVQVISKTVGTPMQKDEYGNVNVLLAGYGGKHHGGGYLADTIMVASWNPELGAVSMFSIPRDLFVKNPFGGYSRINVVFSQLYSRTKDLAEAGSGFIKEVEKITGLTIPYFATVDFEGFKKVIDQLGGVEVNVPKTLDDYQFPNDELKTYERLTIPQGRQHMDGELALKYARSRHSSSDFDRSLRQQLVLSAVKDKLLTQGLTLEKMKSLYAEYREMVNTNVSLNEMLRTIQYLDKVKPFSFGLNSSYSYDRLSSAQKGSFLYNPSRDLFGGAAVLLPLGATANKVDHYDIIHNYADFATHLQKFLLENAKIEIINGIDKEYLRKKNIQKIAEKIAVKIKRYGMQIFGVGNAEASQELTTAVIYSSGTQAEGYEATITALKNFIPIDQVSYITGVQKTIIDDYGNMLEVFTGADVQIILGNTYFTHLQQNPLKSDEIEILYR